MRKLLVSRAVLVCAAVMAIFAPGALATPTTCDIFSGSNPDPGAKVNGGLEVPGGAFCFLDDVTVTGGIVVDAGGVLDVEDGSTVNGGLVVNSGGELFVGVFGGSQVTINGGLVMNSTDFSFVLGARINGGASFTGNIGDTPVCGNDIHGDVVVSNVSNGGAFLFLGDPEDPPFDVPCPGNTIHGSLSISNSASLEVEGNTITGSVSLEASTLELNGNTIGGSLSCSGGTVILPPAGPDPSGNTVHGSNTCP